MSATTPAAWYELSAALSAARAVSVCALDCLPPTGIENQEVMQRRINHVGDLIGGIQILLERSAIYLDELDKN